MVYIEIYSRTIDLSSTFNKKLGANYIYLVQRQLLLSSKSASVYSNQKYTGVLPGNDV